MAVGSLRQVSERIIKLVDRDMQRHEILETGDEALRDRYRTRGLSVTEAREVERKVGVRGGLVGALQQKDPHFTFRLGFTVLMVGGMLYTSYQSGKFEGVEDFDPKGGFQGRNCL